MCPMPLNVVVGYIQEGLRNSDFCFRYMRFELFSRGLENRWAVHEGLRVTSIFVSESYIV